MTRTLCCSFEIIVIKIEYIHGNCNNLKCSLIIAFGEIFICTNKNRQLLVHKSRLFTKWPKAISHQTQWWTRARKKADVNAFNEISLTRVNLQISVFCSHMCEINQITSICRIDQQLPIAPVLFILFMLCLCCVAGKQCRSRIYLLQIMNFLVDSKDIFIDNRDIFEIQLNTLFSN